MFALLEHTTRDGVHWDFLLEAPGRERLPTWRLNANPLDTPAAPIIAEPLPDHRDRYLDYQGPISGGRGDVRRLDRGEATVMCFEPPELSAEVHGRALRGAIRIRSGPEGGLRFEVSNA